MWRGLKVYSGICPDPECHTKLYFPSYASSNVECTGCGQHHAKESLLRVEDVEDPDLALRSLLRSVLLGQTPSKTTPDLVKVKGYSNYHCKLLSPLLTFYGMDKRTGEAKLLREMSQSDIFDCALLGDRAFQIELEHVETAGYGRDKTGSVAYLKDTLEAIKVVNDNEERLVPIHVDGDGHCLVHAISRALVGREIFWHALRVNLKNHLETEINKYKGLFRDFIDDEEWKDIISEADPYFQPPNGEGLGLRNIHLFGLANVLHRPIILLDSVSGMQSSGDYSGIFLPALIPVDKCKSRDNVLNKPLAVAWGSPGRNHFIPLVGIKDRRVPKLPQWLIPKAWGIPHEVVNQYVEFDVHGHCFIGGQRCLQDKYMQRLVKAMDDLFLRKYNIAAHLVTEVHQFVYKPSGMVGVKPEMVTKAAHAAISEGRLRRCLSCNALRELHLDVPADLLKPGGDLYAIAVQTHGALQEGLSYSFPSYQGLVCLFDAEKNVLVPVKQKNEPLLECHLCHGPLRQVMSDGSVVYINGDRTTTPVKGRSRCGCGFKHYWNGKEYENMPEFFPISLEWGGKSVSETVYWFQYETDPSYNSNVYDVAAKLVQQHFPGEFGSERLVQKVVDSILRQTAKKEGENKGALPTMAALNASGGQSKQDPEAAGPFTSSKIILTGEKKKTLHREELTMSNTEKVLKMRTEHHAAIMQKRRSGEPAKKTPEKGAKIPKQQQSGTKPQPDNSNPGVSTDVPTSPSSPPPPPPHHPAVARTSKKVRLSTSDGKQRMLTLTMDTTFQQFQELIENELGISPGEQRIRYGFPPCELHPPGEGHDDDPVPLQHNDRVMVEHLKPALSDAHPPDIVMSDVQGGGGVTESVADVERSENAHAVRSAVINALGALTGADLWEQVQHCSDMFDSGGFYYIKAVSDLGQLQPNQHCTLPGLPNKVFAYNASQDRLELCVGQRHIRVQPLDRETLMLAHTSSSQTPAVERPNEQPSGLSSEASFSGAIGQRDTSQNRVAFSGEGRTLSGAQPQKKSAAEFLPPRLLSTNQASGVRLAPRPMASQISSVDPQTEFNEGELQKLAVQDNVSMEQDREGGAVAESTFNEQLIRCQEQGEGNIHEAATETTYPEAMETNRSERKTLLSPGHESSDNNTRNGETQADSEAMEENQETRNRDGDVTEPSTPIRGNSSDVERARVVGLQTNDETGLKASTDHESELMQAEKSCVAEDVTLHSPGGVEVLERETVRDKDKANGNVQQAGAWADFSSTSTNNSAVMQVSFAMEIDSQLKSSEGSASDKLDIIENETRSDSSLQTECLNTDDASESIALETDQRAPRTTKEYEGGVTRNIKPNDFDLMRTEETLETLEGTQQAVSDESADGKIGDNEEKSERVDSS